MERLASLSQEVGQRAKHMLTRVNRRAGRSSDALHEMEASRNAEKEAALAALLNQLRVASRALEGGWESFILGGPKCDILGL